MSASGLQETVCGARPADGDLAAIWRQKRWLEKVDGLVRREDCWATTRTSCAEARFAVVSHPPPLHVHSRGCRIGRCSLCHSVSWTAAAARGTECSTTRLQDCVKWCIANGLLHDLWEERSDDVPLRLLFEMGKAFWLIEEK